MVICYFENMKYRVRLYWLIDCSLTVKQSNQRP